MTEKLFQLENHLALNCITIGQFKGGSFYTMTLALRHIVVVTRVSQSVEFCTHSWLLDKLVKSKTNVCSRLGLVVVQLHVSWVALVL